MFCELTRKKLEALGSGPGAKGWSGSSGAGFSPRKLKRFNAFMVIVFGCGPPALGAPKPQPQGA